MKINITRTEKFNPIAVTLTFETEREYKKFTQFIGELSDEDISRFANKAKSDDYNEKAVINDFDRSEDKILGLPLLQELLVRF